MWLFGAAVLAAQSARTVWDGVYTEEQAKRGQAAYGEMCASCHGVELTGGEQAPALTGPDFMGAWNGLTVGTLFDRVRRTMPQDEPGTLTPEQTADIVSCMLKANKLPAGKTELEKDSNALKQIRFLAERPKN